MGKEKYFLSIRNTVCTIELNSRFLEESLNLCMIRPVYQYRMRTMFFLFLFSLVFVSERMADSRQELPPTLGDLKGQDKSVRQPPDRKDKKGCCKIKYPAGGYDFFLATEDDCRASLYFDRFLGENNTLCFRWEGE
ncbi:LIC_11321 family protein [Leptospira brenneri]|nr:hypothetical protein [Leptospira brenneri]